MFLRHINSPFVKMNHLYNVGFFFILVGAASLALVKGGTFVNEDCTLRCNYDNRVVHCSRSYRCSPYAVCRTENCVRGCYCIDGYHGDGETCTPMYRDCYELYQAGNTANGIYTIRPSNWSNPFQVLCNMTSNGGGWTVFQRRIDGLTNFYRNWHSYKNGFGSLNGDFWLGNDKLYYLAKQKNYELRIDMVSSENSPVFQSYSTFFIYSESEHYKLRLDSQTSRTGMLYNNGRWFSTYDNDNDRCSVYNCAQKHRGGWWYGGISYWCRTCWGRHCSNFVTGSCSTTCTDSNLNGDFDGESGQTIIWYRNAVGRYCNMKYADMKIRPSS